jgi:hypothetical protein
MKMSPLKIVMPWIIVLIPLAWGVYQSVLKSLPLLQVSAASEATPSSTKN